MKKNKDILILGAGISGLTAGLVTGFTVFEATTAAGGICLSYYVRPGDKEHLSEIPPDGEVYRFENGGGHWIFGTDDKIRRFIQQFTPVKSYNRISSVYFSKKNLYVPYPLQNNIRFLDKKIRDKVLKELSLSPKAVPSTMEEWLEKNFGPSLCKLFFNPFHNLYTANLYKRIAPQDAYKSPVDIELVRKGATSGVHPVGYNATFVYPKEGLNKLIQRMAEKCQICYMKEAVRIDTKHKRLYFSDGSDMSYNALISTLPLNKTVSMAGLKVDVKGDPYTSVLVLNIGAVRGKLCPDDHWLYNPDAKSGFHRVGFYSNVDSPFLPRSSQKNRDRVSIYVERAYKGSKPTNQDKKAYSEAVVRELQKWDFIKEAEVVDPSWIDIAYTWLWPGSKWQAKALEVLKKHNIFQIGRFGKWVFQGIAESIRDGLEISEKFKNF